MSEETSSKVSNLKNRAKFALGKSDTFETLDYKKKKFGGRDNRGKVKRGEISRTKFNVEDDEFSNSRGRGLKSNYSGRKTEEVNGNDLRKKRVYSSNVDRKFGGTERRGSRDSEKKSWETHSKNRMFNKTESRDGRKNAENGENRMFVKRDSRENGDNRMFNRRDSRENGENRMFNRRDSRENGENRMFNRRDSRENGENRMFNRRDSREESVVRRNNSENGENRSVFLRKNREEKPENNKQLQSPAEDHEFGKKKFYNKKNLAAAEYSMTSFDRPRRKRRLIRIGYKNDTANKRFDDSLPTIDNTKKQNEDSDTEENAETPEMSQNAQFRAIQPTPSIISFVNENLLGRRREIEFRKAGYNVELPSPLDDIPFSTSSDRERIEESVFRNKLAFFAAAKVSSSFPDPDHPEIAFAGRSNVGKSSLLNSLTRQWGVVRTSDKPGLTQTINFFNLGSKLCLVDLPGYGFAYAKDEVKESWEELVKEYVSTREGLKRVCLLIDTKWGMKARDHELIDLMERSKTKYQIVLTKTDLAFPVDVARRAMQIEESLKTNKSAVQPLMMVSSKTGAGIRSLRTVLSNISRFAKL